MEVKSDVRGGADLVHLGIPSLQLTAGREVGFPAVRNTLPSPPAGMHLS